MRQQARVLVIGNAPLFDAEETINIGAEILGDRYSACVILELPYDLENRVQKK